jgi:hypothetical protein
MGGKQLSFRFQNLNLTGLYGMASNIEGMKPDPDVLKGLLKIAGGYLDASREKAKAKVLQSVEAFLTDAVAKGVKTDVKTVLGGQLADLWGSAVRDVKRIVETETTIVRNTSAYDAIGRVAALKGDSDPTVFFVVVRDNSLCEECKRIHLLDDGVTPRVYKQSEVGSGYHKKGENTPKVAGLHPHCRCTLTILMKGYGFTDSGHVTYISPEHDEYAKQKGEP